MSEKTQLSGPVEVESSSAEIVALKLLEKIFYYAQAKDEEKRDRKYWLKLYSQCLKATKGYDLELVLKDE